MQPDAPYVPFYKRRRFPLLMVVLAAVLAVPLLYPVASQTVGAANLTRQIAGRWGTRIRDQRTVYEFRTDGSMSLVEGEPIPYLPEIGKWSVRWVTYPYSGADGFALLCETTDYEAMWKPSVEAPELGLGWVLAREPGGPVLEGRTDYSQEWLAAQLEGRTDWEEWGGRPMLDIGFYRN